MPGRPPVPIEQRRREGGDVSHRPVPEPVLLGGRPDDAEMAEPPDYLMREAKDYWRDVVGRLSEVGMLDRVDRPALELLATTYARWRRASRMVNREGVTSVGGNGQLILHPAARVERDSALLYLRTAEQFGLTLLSRTRLGIAELQRRSLGQELASALDAGEPVEADVVEDDVQLPGS